MPRRGESNPFLENPEPLGSGSPRVFHIPGKEHLIIREQSVIKFVPGVMFDLDSPLPQEALHETIDRFNIVQQVFDRMRRFGMKIPNFSLVYGEGLKGDFELTPEDRKKMFMVVDRVRGKRLSDFSLFPASALPKIQKFFMAFFDYLEECYKKNQPCFLHMKVGEDLCYGHLVKAERTGSAIEEDVYLVDVGPEGVLMQGGRQGLVMLRSAVMRVIDRDLPFLETKTRPRNPFREVRKAGERLLTTLV